MASFTDIVPQFNPYIQQLPVEAMVQVGMEKQKRYDEGIQKIQSQIDQIGGMDIYSSKHKAYLQSKLNELGNNLSMVAAGDFSNFQLVNSVGGMIGQVVKDPIVKNAYESTQQIRKQQGYMEEARRKGKSSPENEWWFSSQISRWDSDPDLAKKFTGEYIEYRDVGAKLRDIASKIKEATRSVDNPFQTNSDGSIRTDSKGNPLIDDAMRRITVKGVPAEKIYNNFLSGLDDGDKQQLMITGNYHYRNATKVTFQNDIIDTYGAQKKMLHDDLVDLAVKLKTENLTPAQVAEIEAAINNGNERLNSGYFEKEAARRIDEIGKISNLEDYKYKLYTQKYLTNLSKDLANESRTEEILSNPYAQMNMEKKKLEFAVNRARQEHQEFLMSHSLNVAKFNLDQQKFAIEQAEKQALQPIVSFGGLSTGAKVPTLADLDGVIASTTNDITTLGAKYGQLLFPNLTGSARQQALDKLVQQYNTNPKSITDNAQREYVEGVRALQNKLTQTNNLYQSTVNATKDFDNQLAQIFNGQAGGTLNNGTKYSAQELYELRSRIASFVTSRTRRGPDGPETTTTVDVNGFINSLPARLRPLGAVIATGYDEGKRNLSGNDLATYNQAEALIRTISRNVNTIAANKLKAQSDFLSQRMPEVQSTRGTLNMGDKVTATRVENLIGNTIAFYNQFGSTDQVNLSDFNPNTITEWRTGEGAKQLSYVAEKRYDGSGQLVIYKGNEKQVIPLTANELAAYFPSVARQSFMTDVKFRILSSPSLTTNSIGVGDPVNAYMSGYQIPGLASSKYAATTRLDIEGATGNNGGEGDRFQVKLYVYNNSTWKPVVLNQQGYVGAAGVEEIIGAIGPRTVEDALNR